jgi:glycosyltransferase involved in cell wall biosynthesis
LASVLEQITPDVEVLVNNDSCDIEEIAHPQVSYFYHNSGTLCEIYQFLLKQSRGEFVYYLEDDDYLAPDFLQTSLDADLIVGNYCPTYNPNNLLSYIGQYKNELHVPLNFLESLDTERLQLSQHIFKRDHIDDFEFRMDNNIHNDIRLVIHAAHRADMVRTTNKTFYFQTIDGGDNISFPGTTPSINIIKNLDFLNELQ